MRLPVSVTDIAPVGAVLKASEEGEKALRAAGERVNARLLVSEADAQGLLRWERDYALLDGAGGEPEHRRARVRAAMAGGQTLTRARLASLAVSVGGADRGEVREDFAAHAAELIVIKAGRLPDMDGSMAALEEAIARQKPAHLVITTARGADLTLTQTACLHVGALAIVHGEVKAE